MCENEEDLELLLHILQHLNLNLAKTVNRLSLQISDSNSYKV